MCLCACTYVCIVLCNLVICWNLYNYLHNQIPPFKSRSLVLSFIDVLFLHYYPCLQLVLHLYSLSLWECYTNWILEYGPIHSELYVTKHTLLICVYFS